MRPRTFRAFFAAQSCLIPPMRGFSGTTLRLLDFRFQFRRHLDRYPLLRRRLGFRNFLLGGRTNRSLLRRVTSSGREDKQQTCDSLAHGRRV